MKTNRFNVICILGMFVMTACMASSKPDNIIDNGIAGQVFIGPMCPVVQVGQECPDQPYQAVFTVNSPKGERIVQVQTDENGRFKIPLPTGEYILHPESPNGLPFADEQTFVVKEGEFTQVIVNYDSGIR